MSHAKFISAIAALFIAVALVALVALAQGTGDPTAPKNGDYIPPEHCVTNPKIEGCREDSPDNRHTDSTTKPTILISCVALFTAVLMMAFGLTVTTTQKAIFEERLFQLCIALMGVSPRGHSFSALNVMEVKLTITTIKNREIGIADWPQSQPALKEDAIRYAGVLLNRDKVDLPKSANDDETEVRLESETKRRLAEIDSEYSGKKSELGEVQAQIEMRTDAAEGVKSALINGVVEDHQYHSAIDAGLKATEREEHIALTAEKTRHELTRGPKPNTTSGVTGFAIGFTSVEALVTAASFIGQTGTSGAAGAVGLALTAACTNIGSGGYLAGTVLIPRASRKNSPFATAWLYRFLLLLSVAWLVAINFLLGHFRASSGDFGVAFTQFLNSPLNVGDMTGLLLVGFGFIMSAIWCLKFYISQDSYLEYGALGEELRTVRENITNNRSAYTQAIRGRADEARDELDEAVEEAVAGHQLARELKARADDLISQHSKNQEEVLMKATETAMYRRSVLREMLSPHGDVPGYIAAPVDYSNLRLALHTTEDEAAFAAQTEQQKIAIISACTSAKDDIEKVVAQALSLPFGATIHPISMTGGYYVE